MTIEYETLKSGAVINPIRQKRKSDMKTAGFSSMKAYRKFLKEEKRRLKDK